MDLPGYPQSLKICHRPAAAEMTQKILPTKHRSNFCDGFFFKRRSRAPSVQGMVVRVDVHRQRIRNPCDRMRRLQHLPRIQRMKIRKIVLKLLGGGTEHLREPLRVKWPRLKLGQVLKTGVELFQRLGENLQALRVQHVVARIRLPYSRTLSNWPAVRSNSNCA